MTLLIDCGFGVSSVAAGTAAQAGERIVQAPNHKLSLTKVDISGISRILGASRVWDLDWGLPRVKCATEGCYPTPLAAGGGIGYIVK